MEITGMRRTWVLEHCYFRPSLLLNWADRQLYTMHGPWRQKTTMLRRCVVVVSACVRWSSFERNKPTTTLRYCKTMFCLLIAKPSRAEPSRTMPRAMYTKRDANLIVIVCPSWRSAPLNAALRSGHLMPPRPFVTVTTAILRCSLQ